MEYFYLLENVRFMICVDLMNMSYVNVYDFVSNNFDKNLMILKTHDLDENS